MSGRDLDKKLPDRDAPAACGRPRTPPGASWVSKTDVLLLHRCEYAFSLVDSGEIVYEKVISEAQRELLGAGMSFEATVYANAVPAPGLPLAQLLREDHTLIGTPLFVHKRRRLRGIPDGIATRWGDLVPIEIKNHREMQPTDRLELCFYDILLEPHRKRSNKPRRRYGLLRLKDRSEPLEVDLTPLDFERVNRLIARVRGVRKRGTFARVCHCPVCITRPECAPANALSPYVTLIYGISSDRARLLEALNIYAVSDVAACDPEAVTKFLKHKGHHVSKRVVEMWRAHAQAFLTNEIVWIGAERITLPSRFVALDLEYTMGRYIWLIGVALVDGERVELRQFWIDSRDELPYALSLLAQVLRDWAREPVVTWNGLNADIPQLERAALTASADEQGALRGFRGRHIDVLHHVQRNMRFPIPWMSLSQFARYYGVSGSSNIANGLEAVSLYQKYLRSESRPEKDSLRERLLEYNADDLNELVGVARAVARARPPGDSIAVSASLTGKQRRELAARQVSENTVKRRQTAAELPQECASEWPSEAEMAEIASIIEIHG